VETTPLYASLFEPLALTPPPRLRFVPPSCSMETTLVSLRTSPPKRRRFSLPIALNACRSPLKSYPPPDPQPLGKSNLRPFRPSFPFFRPNSYPRRVPFLVPLAVRRNGFFFSVSYIKRFFMCATPLCFLRFFARSTLGGGPPPSVGSPQFLSIQWGMV